MKRVYKYFRKLLLLIWVVVLPGISGCVSDSSLCDPPEDKESGKIYLKFTMLTRDDGKRRSIDKDMTRAEVTDDVPADERKGTDAENYIDVNDIRFFVFDNDAKFISELKDSKTTPIANTAFVEYEVIAELDHEYVDNSPGAVSFFIVSFANLKGWDADAIEEPTRGATTIESFLSDNSGILLKQKADPEAMLDLTASTRHFPMAGMQKFSVPKDLIFAGGDVDAEGNHTCDITTVTKKHLNMLRAVAKIEIVDKINVGKKYDEGIDGAYPWNADAENAVASVRIGSGQINGIMNHGTVFPDIDISPGGSSAAKNKWPGGETAQVDFPSVPSGVTYLKPASFPGMDNDPAEGDAGCSIAFAPDRGATLSREDRCPVFSCYVFEYDKTILTGIPTSQEPYITVTTREYGNGDIVVQPIEFPVKLAEYTNGKPTKNLQALLRNHIYTFEITGVSQDATVNWTVCDMDTYTPGKIEFN